MQSLEGHKTRLNQTRVHTHKHTHDTFNVVLSCLVLTSCFWFNRAGPGPGGKYVPWTPEDNGLA